MSFNSFSFLLFFVVVLTAYWALSVRWRKYFLLAASYVFYGSWDYRFLSLILISTAVDYCAANAIARSSSDRRRRVYLLASVVTNLGILAFFKYFNFFIDNLTLLLRSLGCSAPLHSLDIILPVGISFYTFQTMSYTVDVYRKHVAPTRDFVAFATYVAFFPQLVAGPIERFHRLFPQLEEPGAHGPAPQFLRRAVFLVLQGYVKKVVLADTIAPIVDGVFRTPAAHNAGELLEAAILFTAQIYFDFSGYSDIARGVANFFGVELIANFRAPLLSRSITEFWRRWHISLSHWLRDYLYIPLGGNRRGRRRTYANLLATMLLGGLWHGASWRFVVWGGLHGLFLAGERATSFFTADTPPNLTFRTLPADLLRCLATAAAVTAIFVFFRAASMRDAWLILSGVATGEGLGSVATLRLGCTLAALLFLDLPVLFTDNQAWILAWPVPVRLAVYTLMLVSLIIFGGHYQQPFIYFAF